MESVCFGYSEHTSSVIIHSFQGMKDIVRNIRLPATFGKCEKMVSSQSHLERVFNSKAVLIRFGIAYH